MSAYRIGGQVVDQGTAVSGQPVFVVDTADADPSNWTVETATTTAADGTWSVIVPSGDLDRYHAVTQFEDSGTTKNAESKPFVTAQPVLRAVEIPIQFEIPSPTISAGSAIPDSAVLNIKASDYDGLNNNWVANIGPDLPDANGNPSTTTVSINGEDFTAVRYSASNSDASQTTTEIATGDPIAIVYTVINRSPTLDAAHYLDADTQDDFAHLNQDSGDHRILAKQANVDARGDSIDSNAHTFAYRIGSTDGGSLDRDGTNILSDGSATDPSLNGLTVGSRADLADYADIDALEITVLDNPSDQDISDEVSRHQSVYNQ